MPLFNTCLIPFPWIRKTERGSPAGLREPHAMLVLPRMTGQQASHSPPDSTASKGRGREKMHFTTQQTVSPLSEQPLNWTGPEGFESAACTAASPLRRLETEQAGLVIYTRMVGRARNHERIPTECCRESVLSNLPQNPKAVMKTLISSSTLKKFFYIVKTIKSKTQR